ncbi:MAG: hypothetical protein ABSE48_18045 [Verrucomicrobiota bacterium]|jgi:hypothetical protein
MELLQNGVAVGKIISNVENPDPSPERPPGILTHRTTYTLVLQSGIVFRPSRDAQYAIAGRGQADHSIEILNVTGDTVKYRRN